jgi:hypothetical protein
MKPAKALDAQWIPTGCILSWEPLRDAYLAHAHVTWDSSGPSNLSASLLGSCSHPWPDLYPHVAAQDSARRGPWAH